MSQKINVCVAMAEVEDRVYMAQNKSTSEENKRYEKERTSAIKKFNYYREFSTTSKYDFISRQYLIRKFCNIDNSVLKEVLNVEQIAVIQTQKYSKILVKQLEKKSQSDGQRNIKSYLVLELQQLAKQINQIKGDNSMNNVLLKATVTIELMAIMLPGNKEYLKIFEAMENFVDSVFNFAICKAIIEIAIYKRSDQEKIGYGMIRGSSKDLYNEINNGNPLIMEEEKFNEFHQKIFGENGLGVKIIHEFKNIESKIPEIIKKLLENENIKKMACLAEKMEEVTVKTNSALKAQRNKDKTTGDLHCEMKLFLYLKQEGIKTKDIRFSVSKPTCADCTVYFYGVVDESCRPEFSAYSQDHFDKVEIAFSCDTIKIICKGHNGKHKGVVSNLKPSKI